MFSGAMAENPVKHVRTTQVREHTAFREGAIISDFARIEVVMM